MATTHTYWATIGRNVGSAPMSDEDWNNYRAELARRIGRIGHSTITSFRDGVSRWGETDEQTFGLLFTVAPTLLPILRHELARLARDYDQEAIGLVGGPGETLVYAEQGASA